MEGTITSYSELGKKAVEDRVGSKTLEARVKKLQREKRVSNEQAGEIVTGFVDESINRKKPYEAYSVVEGFGRFLYNGEYDEVRGKILELMAQGIIDSGEGDPTYNLRKFLGEFGDEDALGTIAEHCVKKKPKLAMNLTKGDIKKVADNIIELHARNYEHRNIVAHCLSVKEDFTGLVKLARRHARSDPHFAWRIIEKHGTEKDYVWFARLGNVDPALAYKAILRYKNKHKTLFKRIRTKYINKEPIMAGHKFFEDKMSSGIGFIHKVCRDHEGILEVSRVLLKRGRHYSPVMAAKFLRNACLHDAPELKKAQIEIFKQLEKRKIHHNEIEEARRLIGGNGAVAYLKQGGDASLADSYAGKHCDDDINRELGKALSELPKGKCGWHATAAYERIADIREKTQEDEKLFARLRKRVLKEAGGSAGTVFLGRQDHEGMRQFVEQNIDKHPAAVYVVVSSEVYQDKSMLGQCRKNILRRGMNSARIFFEDHKDKEGLKMLKEKFYENIDASVAEELLG